MRKKKVVQGHRASQWLVRTLTLEFPIHQTPVDLDVNADSVSESPVGPEVLHL